MAAELGYIEDWMPDAIGLYLTMPEMKQINPKLTQNKKKVTCMTALKRKN